MTVDVPDANARDLEAMTMKDTSTAMIRYSLSMVAGWWRNGRKRQENVEEFHGDRIHVPSGTLLPVEYRVS